MIYPEARQAIMDGLDACYVHLEDGRMPDHVIVSDSAYEEITPEIVRKEPLSGEGLLSMTLWHSPALDRRGKVALLLSDEVFHEILDFDEPKDL